MFRIIPIFLLFAGAFMCINSCDIDMYGTYSFSHVVIYSLQDNSDETATENIETVINDYLSLYIDDLDGAFTYTGTYYDARQYGNTYLYELFNNFSNDGDYINSQLQTGEYVQYFLYMTGDSVHEVIGYYIWLPLEEDEEEEE